MGGEAQRTPCNNEKTTDMKKLFLFLTIVLALASCQPKLTEQVDASFPNGQPQYVKMLDKSGNCVKEIEYYESGQIKMEGSVKDGQREGEWKAYFPDGRPQSIADFKAGVMEGRTQVYWKNGNLRWEGYYKAEKRSGKWRYYDEIGNLHKEVDYGE